MFIDYMMTRVHLGLIVINRNECVAGEDMLLLDLLALRFGPLGDCFR